MAKLDSSDIPTFGSVENQKKIRQNSLEAFSRWARKSRLGARALYLYRENKTTVIPDSTDKTGTLFKLEGPFQNGCIRHDLTRMVKMLYERVPVGAKVVVL